MNKNFNKLLISILLIIALTLNVTSCDVLEGIGIDFGEIISGITSPDSDDNDNQDGIIDDGADDSDDTEQGTDDVIGGDDTADDENDSADDSDEDNTDADNGTGDSTTDDNDDTLPEKELHTGGILYLPNEVDPVTSDPYVNVNVTEFYANYTPAISYMDSYYRTKHNLMSGSIAAQDAAPTVSSYQPVIDGKLVQNTTYIFSEDGNTYYVVNAYGEIVNRIYRGGAYVTLEEVAAYVYAFGEIPANHSESKNTKPTQSAWGKYLRVNDSNFSGSTTKYPYEPVLPNISGCGGKLYYYEMDIGTTGTDTGNGYAVAVYNNGTTITRGAARIVHTQYDLDRDGVIEIGENYVFYTYNHYNDFQEYLNYEGGWGEMFGNITGGGTLSSKYDYNPTPYVEVAYSSFVYADGSPANLTQVVVVMYIPRREEV